MEILLAIVTVIKTLPALINFTKEMAHWMRDTFGEDPAKFLMDASDTFKAAREAKTSDDKKRAASDIATLIKRL